MTEYEKKCLTCKNNYKPSDCKARCEDYCTRGLADVTYFWVE